MEERGSDRNDENAGEQSGKDRLSTQLKAVVCVAFLVFSIALLMMSEGSWLVWLLLLLPCWVCEEWLADKIFTKRSGWSTAEVGFSVWRILFGVILVLLFFSVVYSLTLIAQWLV